MSALRCVAKTQWSCENLKKSGITICIFKQIWISAATRTVWRYFIFFFGSHFNPLYWFDCIVVYLWISAWKSSYTHGLSGVMKYSPLSAFEEAPSSFPWLQLTLNTLMGGIYVCNQMKECDPHGVPWLLQVRKSLVTEEVNVCTVFTGTVFSTQVLT